MAATLIVKMQIHMDIEFAMKTIRCLFFSFLLLPIIAHAEPLPVPTGDDNPLTTAEELEAAEFHIRAQYRCRKEGIDPESEAFIDCVIKKVEALRAERYPEGPST